MLSADGSRMVDALGTFRTTFGSHPLLLTIGLFVLISLPGYALKGLRAGAWPLRAGRALLTAAALAGSIAYPSVATWYASDPHFFDNAEPTVLSIAWVYHTGGALYHAVDAAERYSHIYGPLAFMVHAAALALFEPSIAVSKWLGVVAGLTSLGFIYAAARRYCPPQRAAVLTGVCALFLLTFRHISFWVRPDSLQLTLVAAGVYFADMRGTSSLAASLVGLTSGALWNLKFTGPLYSLSAFAMLQRRLGAGAVGIAIVAAAAATVLPFTLPGVSAANYVAWARLSGRTGLLWSLLRQNVEWAAFLCLPFGLAWSLVRERSRAADMRLTLLALAAGVCGVTVAAAKPGAGPYHLIPFVPVIASLVARTIANHPLTAFRLSAYAAISAYAVVLVLLAAAQCAYLVTIMRERRALHDVEDVQRFLSEHAGKVEMAYGRTEALSLIRPILTFRNDSYLIDQPAVREYQLQGLQFPRATIEAIERCRVVYWLVPRGEAPFSGINAYDAVLMQPLYPPELRQAFAATHTLVETTSYYDVWRCRTADVR